MLDTIMAEQPMFDLRILPALGRLFKGSRKVSEQPIRVAFVQDDGGQGPWPATGAVYSVQPLDGTKREIYIPYHDNGLLDLQHIGFVERDSSGELSRRVPEKEERVPNEWRNAIKAHLIEKKPAFVSKETLG